MVAYFSFVARQWQETFGNPLVLCCSYVRRSVLRAKKSWNFWDDSSCAKSLQGEAPCCNAVYGSWTEMSPASPVDPRRPPGQTPLDSQTPLPYGQHAAWLVECKEDNEELMNKGELTTLPMLQGVALSTASGFCKATLVESFDVLIWAADIWITYSPVKDFSFTDCKNTVMGTEFRGTSATTTASGAACQRWDQDSPHNTHLNDDPAQMVELGLRGEDNTTLFFRSDLQWKQTKTTLL